MYTSAVFIIRVATQKHDLSFMSYSKKAANKPGPSNHLILFAFNLSWYICVLRSLKFAWPMLLFLFVSFFFLAAVAKCLDWIWIVKMFFFIRQTKYEIKWKELKVHLGTSRWSLNFAFILGLLRFFLFYSYCFWLLIHDAWNKRNKFNYREQKWINR